MTRYAIHVVDLDEGTVSGTNDVDEVRDIMDDDRYVILMAQSGVYFHGDSSENEIDRYTPEDDGDEDTDEEDDEEEPPNSRGY